MTAPLPASVFGADAQRRRDCHGPDFRIIKFAPGCGRNVHRLQCRLGLSGTMLPELVHRNKGDLQRSLRHETALHLAWQRTLENPSPDTS